jgi:mRNA interferase YafQ
LKTLVWSPGFKRSFKRAIRRKPDLQDKIEQALELLANDAFSLLLHTHKLKGDLSGSWACTVDFEYRIIFEFIFIAIPRCLQLGSYYRYHSGMPSPCRRPQRTCPQLARRPRSSKQKAELALAEAEALKLQARLEDLTVWEMEKVTESKRLQNLHLLDGLLGRGLQDAQCPHGEHQEDGCRVCQAEGQEDEGGGAGDAGVAAGIV